MEQTPALGTRIIPKSRCPTKQTPCMLHSFLLYSAWPPSFQTILCTFHSSKLPLTVFNQVWPVQTHSSNATVTCDPIAEEKVHGTLAETHRVVPRRCLFQSWIGACFLLSRPSSNLEAVQLHQIPLSNQSAKGVQVGIFLWPCKMCRHKELQKTRSFIPDLSEFFPCPPFQGHFSNTGPCIQQLEKPFTLHKNKDLLIFFSQQKESHSCEILSRSVGPGCWFSPCRHVETMNYLGVDHWTLIWIGRGA